MYSTFTEKPKLTQPLRAATSSKFSRQLFGRNRNIGSTLQPDFASTASRFNHDFSRVPSISSTPLIAPLIL